MSFISIRPVFLQAQDSSWYIKFVQPVINKISENKKQLTILDIGTGSGKLPELLIKNNPNLDITGIDINKNMIDEARKRIKNDNVSFEYQYINKKLDFNNNKFDIVTFCSVLFLVDDNTKEFLIEEAFRVLKPDGKIIILTPSGKKTILFSFIEVFSFPLNIYNWTFIIWKLFTTNRAKEWVNLKWLQKFSEKNKLKYTKELTFNNNALIETLSV
jgi:ubiquinone/menaquinone biosynthesis C-methylase UbiE